MSDDRKELQIYPRFPKLEIGVIGLFISVVCLLFFSKHGIYSGYAIAIEIFFLIIILAILVKIELTRVKLVITINKWYILGYFGLFRRVIKNSDIIGYYYKERIEAYDDVQFDLFLIIRSDKEFQIYANYYDEFETLKDLISSSYLFKGRKTLKYPGWLKNNIYLIWTIGGILAMIVGIIKILKN